MNILNKRYAKYAAIGVLAAGILAVPVRAAILATEEPIAGATVVMEEYCQNVAAGAVSQPAVEAAAEPDAAQDPADRKSTRLNSSH